MRKYFVIILASLTLLPILLFAQNAEEATDNATDVGVTVGTGLAEMDPNSESFKKLMVLLGETLRIVCFPTDFAVDDSTPPKLVIDGQIWAVDANGELINEQENRIEVTTSTKE